MQTTDFSDATLDAYEEQELRDHESVIKDGLRGFVSVGRALSEIRDKRLYRGRYASFEEYLHERWQLGRAYAYRLISGSEVAERIPGLANEAQAREMTRVPFSEQRDVWDRAKERAVIEGRTPTAQDIKAAAGEPTITTARPDRELEEPWVELCPLWDDALTMLTDLEDTLKALYTDSQGCWLVAHEENCRSRIGDIRSTIKHSKPHAGCPMCAGLGAKCEACRGRGWLPKGRYDAIMQANS